MKSEIVKLKFRNKEGRGLTAIKNKTSPVKTYNVRVLMTDAEIYESYNNFSPDFTNYQAKVIMIDHKNGTAVVDISKVTDKKIKKFLQREDIQIVVSFGVIKKYNLIDCIYGFSVIKSESVDLKSINNFMLGN